MIVVISVLLGAYIGEPEPKSAQTSVKIESTSVESEKSKADVNKQQRNPAQENTEAEQPVDAETEANEESIKAETESAGDQTEE